MRDPLVASNIPYVTTNANGNPLNRLAEDINRTAHEKGWHGDGERPFLSAVALMHSELSEAIEQWRDPVGSKKPFYMVGDKPEGWATELIDCVIRIFDTLAEENINIDYILKAKTEYNKTRPYRHGGKLA